MSTTTPTPRNPDKRGVEAREQIRVAFRRRRAAGMPSPVLDELVEETGLSKSDVRHHIAWMIKQHPPQVRIEPARREIVLLEDGPP